MVYDGFLFLWLFGAFAYVLSQYAKTLADDGLRGLRAMPFIGHFICVPFLVLCPWTGGLMVVKYGQAAVDTLRALL